jgi:tetratricopeptide (TPR) repeat protein
MRSFFAVAFFLFSNLAWSNPVAIKPLLDAIEKQSQEPVESLLQQHLQAAAPEMDSAVKRAAVRFVVERAEQEQDLSKKAKLYFTAGWLSRHWTEQNANAVYYYDLSFDLAERAGSRALMASAMLQAMQVFVDLAMYQDALQYLFKAELVFQKYNYEGFRSVTGSLFSIGQFFYRAGNYQLSVQYFEKALVFNDLYDDAREVMLAYNTLGLSHLRLGNHQKAIEAFQISNQMAKEIGDLSWEALTYGNIGMVFAERKEFPAAIVHLTYDMETSERQKGWMSACNAAVLLAEVYLELNDLKSARIHLNKAIAYEQLQPSTYLKRMLAALKARIFSTELDFKSAFFAQQTYELLHQELTEQGRRTDSIQKQKRHAYALENAAMQKELAVQEVLLTQGLLYRIVVVLTILVFLILTGAVVLIKRERKLKAMTLQDSELQKSKWELVQLKKRISWQVHYVASDGGAANLLTVDDEEQLRTSLNACYDHLYSRLKMSYPELNELDLKWMGLVKLNLPNEDLNALAKHAHFDLEGWLQQLAKKLGGIPTDRVVSLIQQL